MAERIYDPAQIEKKWQAWWDTEGVNNVDVHNAKNPYYVLMMFPYPSAEGLHVGNVYAFTGADIHGRFKRLQGYDVFEPVGFDAFGIHSENFAMKINRHPAELIPSNVANFTRQLKMMGLMYDWRYQVDTTSPEYYKWTQWIFLQLYKNGYAYRDTKEVNFCPACGTVIADEQVNPDGTCERHSDTMVERRKMPCWFFAITKFADRLVDNHEWLDWSDVTKTAQIRWVGRSKGAEVEFPIAGREEKIIVFTTRPDTLFGATFMVLSPEHPLVDTIADPSLAKQIAAYRERSAAMTEQERIENKEKTGLDIGVKAVNPVNGEEIPVFIADYVMMDYGTGAIMAVPNGDHRDFEFARKFNLPVQCIIDPAMDQGSAEDLSLIESVENEIMTSLRNHPIIGGTFSEHSPTPPPLVKIMASTEGKEQARSAIHRGLGAWSGPGRIINSSNDEISLDGKTKEESIAAITAWLESKNLGSEKRQFRLRDWGISRQRYWGPPIPIVYDENGDPHPVPEDQLPVMLPEMTDFRPKGDGRGPLATSEEFVNATIDGKTYRRETDVMDNFLDSAWYFLRYPSARDDQQAYDLELMKKWLPVDMYIGGNEHAVLHLLYTRFICMALAESGVLEMGESSNRDKGEPFKKFRAHGLLIREGSKMSKSKGNVVNPDEFVAEHGADTLRTYLMFLGPYTQGGDFRDKDIQGVRRFFNRVHAYYFDDKKTIVPDEDLPKDVRVKTHQMIRKATSDLESLSYNTAIAACMELLNTLKASEQTSDFVREAFCLMLAPFAPHLAEEIWHTALGREGSVFGARWPEHDEKLTILDEVEIPVQVNGRVRDRIIVARDAPKETLESTALECDGVKRNMTNGAQVRKVIVVPGRLVNVIVK